MKDQRHKRKESFSVLLISNIDRSSRQFQISMFTIRMVIFLLVLLLAILGWLGYQYATGYHREEALRQQMHSQEEKTAQLEQEKETWNSEKLALEAENEALRQEQEQIEAAEEEEPEPQAEVEPQVDSTHPTRYPYQGSGVLEGTYTEEQPYITISTYAGGTIVAAGDGAVTAIGQDDTYKIILEITHPSGYTTRYLCRGEAELQVEEGAQVSAGDVLVNIATDDTLMDYQILQEGETVDPLSIIEAKG